MTNNERWNDFYKQIVTINNQLVAIITPHSRGVLLTQKKSCIKLKIGRQREIMAPLSSSRPTPVYDCKQNELYSVALIGWKSFELNQAAFEAFNTRYTVAFGTTMKAAVVSAKQLPDEFQRSDEHKTLRINLKNKANDVLIKWQQLESFINNGFPEEELESKKQAAGHAYYRDAANDDWESVDSLLTDASAFVAGYAAELTTGGMPALFAPDFATLKTEFEVLYSDFTNAEQQAPEQTDAKIAANNLVYKNLLSMFEDGQKIFRNSAAAKQRFVFSHVLELIGGGAASDSAGYDVEDYFIPPGGSVIVGDTPAADEKVYARVVLGDSSGVVICTTDGTTGPCLTGYNLALAITFKGVFGDLGLDMSKPQVQVTNPGTTEVLFRGGKKF